MTAEQIAQRSAVASLIGRCEGIIWDAKMLTDAERLRLFALLQEACAAFDMAPPQIERLENV